MVLEAGAVCLLVACKLFSVLVRMSTSYSLKVGKTVKAVTEPAWGQGRNLQESTPRERSISPTASSLRHSDSCQPVLGDVRNLISKAWVVRGMPHVSISPEVLVQWRTRGRQIFSELKHPRIRNLDKIPQGQCRRPERLLVQDFKSSVF